MKKSGVAPIVRKRAVIHHGTDDTVTVYTNSVKVVWSTVDVCLLCGQVEESTDARVVVRDRLKLYMSIEHTRQLMAILERKLAKWESVR